MQDHFSLLSKWAALQHTCCTFLIKPSSCLVLQLAHITSAFVVNRIYFWILHLVFHGVSVYLSDPNTLETCSFLILNAVFNCHPLPFPFRLSGRWGGVRRWSSVTAGSWTQTEPWWGRQWRTVWGPLSESCLTWHTTTVSTHTHRLKHFTAADCWHINKFTGVLLETKIVELLQTADLCLITVRTHMCLCVCRVGQYEDGRTGGFNNDSSELCSESPSVSSSRAEVRHPSTGKNHTLTLAWLSECWIQKYWLQFKGGKSTQTIKPDGPET